MAQLGSAGGQLKLPIGQSPRAISPDINRELQAIYNALHISNEYLTALREEIEGNDDQDPSQSLKFRRTFWSTAGTTIKAGDVCCAIGDRIFPGVGTTPAAGASNQPALQLWHRTYPRYTGLRSDFGLRITHILVALTDADPAQPVKVGSGPGVIRVPGILCGQLIWAQAALGLVARASTINGGPFGLFLVEQPVLGVGLVYTSNPRGDSAGVPWEGVPMAGYPFESGSWVYRGSTYFYPVGIAIRNDYILFNDFKAE